MPDGNFREMPTGTVYIEDIEIGQTRRLFKTITDREIGMFADVSSDHNPVHLCDDYAAQTMFQGRIAHGMLTAALISAVIGQQLPGHGTVYLKQNLTFLAPVRPGDVVEAVVSVREIDMRRKRLSLDCRCLVGDTVVLKGDALVLAPARPTD